MQSANTTRFGKNWFTTPAQKQNCRLRPGSTLANLQRWPITSRSQLNPYSKRNDNIRIAFYMVFIMKKSRAKNIANRIPNYQTAMRPTRKEVPHLAFVMPPLVTIVVRSLEEKNSIH
jgi:hypothetical protein